MGSKNEGFPQCLISPAKWKSLNDALAELQFFRVALQVFFINVVGHSPEPAATLHAMEEDVVRALAKLPIEPQTAQGDQRRKAMVLAHAEAFFAHFR
jgi:hypothetical protein